jgi:hypothetical protein
LGKKWEKKPKKREERKKRKLYKGLGEKRKSMVKGRIIKRKHKGLYRAEIDINPNIRPQPL